MRFFTCTNFEGHNPVGTSAVVIAMNHEDAKAFLIIRLAEIRLPQTEAEVARIVVTEVFRNKAQVIILQDGEY